VCGCGVLYLVDLNFDKGNFQIHSVYRLWLLQNS
jgi:hypothetical protein